MSQEESQVFSTGSHLNLALARVRRMVLENLDGHDLIGAPLPTLGHLSERPSSQELQHLVAVGHGAQDLVLHQLVVALAVGVAALGGGGGMSDGLSRGGASACSASADPVGGHWRRELLQDLDAVAAVHLLALTLQAVLLVVEVALLRGRLCVFHAAAGRGGRGRGRGGGRSPADAAGAVGRPHHRLLPGAGRVVGAVGRVEPGPGRGGRRSLSGTMLVVSIVCLQCGRFPGRVLHLEPFGAGVGAGGHRGGGERLDMGRHDDLVCRDEGELSWLAVDGINV